MTCLTYQLTESLFYEVDFHLIVRKGREMFREFFEVMLDLFPEAHPLETGFRFSRDDADSVYGLARLLTNDRCSEECAETLLSITKDTDAIDEFLTWFEDFGFEFDTDVLAVVLGNKGSLKAARNFILDHEFVGVFSDPEDFAGRCVAEKLEDDEDFARVLLEYLDLDGLGEALLAKYKVFTAGSEDVVVFE